MEDVKVHESNITTETQSVKKQTLPKEDVSNDAVQEDVATAEKPKRRKRESPVAGEGSLLFGKYDISEVLVSDQSIVKYVRFTPNQYPNIFGRRKFKSYYNSHINIVERLITKLMRGGTGKKVGGKVIRTKGRLQGKKLKVTHIVEDAFERISKSGKNPVQVLVNAIQNSAPIEETTRVRYGGIGYNVAVGISPRRRVDVALKNIALAALIGAFRKKKTLSQALADELSMASDKSADSYAIKKKIETERIAKRAR
ncbi:MAG: 30S ribosomal protein S7 [Candidatus Marsarchaeota archaeon]|jgi:small subunit ribosomal protein S7|nr:30S ribosomal protein S7 [Candidatus Marsarchaeota archaeon]